MAKKISITDFSAGMIPSQRSNVSGAASFVSFFDIYSDPKKLIPVTDWEDFATTAEKNFDIQTMGGRNQGDKTILGLGLANTAWMSEGWNRRVQITPDNTNSVTYGAFDLSDLGADFWDNVKSDGGDIRLVDANQDPIVFKLQNFDAVAETGYIIWRGGLLATSYYLYWDNATAASPGSTYTDIFSGISGNFWTLDGDKTDYSLSSDLASGTYSNAGSVLLGDGHDTNDLNTTDSAASVIDNGDDLTVSFIYQGSDKTAGDIIDDNDLGFRLMKTASGYVQIYIRTQTTGRTSSAGTIDICDGNPHLVQVCYVNGILNVYIDGTTDITYDLTADDEDINSSSGAEWHIRPAGNAIEFVNAGDHQTTSGTLGDMVINSSTFWTIGTYQIKADITPVYGGVQVYTKELDGTEWTELIRNDYPVRTADYSPIHGMIFEMSNLTRFFVSTVGVNNFTGFQYLAEIGVFGDDWLNWTGTTGAVPLSEEALPVPSYPVDKKFYFNRGSSAMGSVNGATVVETAFTAYGTPECHTPYDQYLAIGSDLGGKSVVQLWDMDSNLARALIDLGAGNVRVVGNVFGALFMVINNNLTDDDLGAGDQSLDIKVWTGGAEAKPWITFKSPTTYDGEYTDDFQQPVLNQVEYFKSGMLFWAKVYDNDNNEIEGIFAIGKNERNGQYALTMYRNTAGMGDVTSLYRVGNAILIAHNRDGSLSRASNDAYTANSVWQSVWLQGSGNDTEDQLQAVEVNFEPLTAGQSVTLEYRIAGGSWITIFTESETGAIKHESTLVESTNNDLPAFREIQFRITSTGGSAAITGLHFIYEELNND